MTTVLHEHPITLLKVVMKLLEKVACGLQNLALIQKEMLWASKKRAEEKT